MFRSIQLPRSPITPLAHLQKRFNVQDLRPKQAKVKKTFKGFFKLHQGGSLKGTVPLTEFALVASEGKRLKDIQLDNARTVMRRAMKGWKQGKFLIRTMPNIPVTSKGSEARMGKGKGAIDYWGVWVSPGQVMLEISGVPKEIAEKALNGAAAVLPLRSHFIQGSENKREAQVLPKFILDRIHTHEALEKIKNNFMVAVVQSMTKKPAKIVTASEIIAATECAFCLKAVKTKHGREERMISCATCGSSGHPSCLKFNSRLTRNVREYKWNCMTCKSCMICSQNTDDKLLLFCDECDRAVHTYCLDPPLEGVPKGPYSCDICTSQYSAKVSPSSLFTTPGPKQRRPNVRKSVTEPKTLTSRASHHVSEISQTSIRKRGRPFKVSTCYQYLFALIHVESDQCAATTQILAVSEGESDAEPERFGNKLSSVEADNSKYKPDAQTREHFLSSKQKAVQSTPKLSSTALEYQEILKDDGINEPTVKSIIFGDYEICAWYSAPYPEEYCVDILFICEGCLKYMKSEYMLTRHREKCPVKYPPGDEVYRDGMISVFEVDGRRNKIYCQNLCLLGKMFLDHKTLYYDVEPFLFYVMTEYDSRGYHFVGYFSKEKHPSSDYNLSCIVTLPIHQRKGYGQFLIEFSYLLSQHEQRPGSPEKPLSDLGLISYRSFWKRNIIKYLMGADFERLSISRISKDTCMTPEDISVTLFLLGILVKNESGNYVIVVNKSLCESFISEFEKRDNPTAHKKYLRIRVRDEQDSIPESREDNESNSGSYDNVIEDPEAETCVDLHDVDF